MPNDPSVPFPNQLLAGQAGLVTGAGRGIGQACAIGLAEAGAQVAVLDIDGEAAERTAAACRERGVRAIAIACDVADADAVDAAVAQGEAELGAVSLAISNAAWSQRELFHTADMEAFRRTIDVTMWGALHLVRSVARHLIAADRAGAIALIGSTHSDRPIPGAMAYNMSKAALDIMARTAATELAEHRIRLNVIHPGWVDTPGERKFFTDETIAERGGALPWGRLARPDEIARGAVFTLLPGSEYVNGATLLIDGGATLPVAEMYRLRQQPTEG